MAICDWLLSFSMFSRFICVVVCINAAFTFMAEYSIAWIYHILFIHQLMEFGLLPILTHKIMLLETFIYCISFYMNICEQNSLGFTPRNGIAKSYGNLHFNFWKIYNISEGLICVWHLAKQLTCIFSLNPHNFLWLVQLLCPFYRWGHYNPKMLKSLLKYPE